MCFDPYVLNQHSLSNEELLSVLLWGSGYYYCNMKNIYDKYLKSLAKLFCLLEHDVMEMFSMVGRNKSKHKFTGTKVWKAGEGEKTFDKS